MIRFVRRGLAALLELLGTDLGPGMEPDAEPRRVWREALRRCGVDNVVEKRTALFKPRRFEGVRVPFTIRITPSGLGGTPDAIVRVGGAPAVVSLRHESMQVRALPMVGATEHVLGDPVFDEAFFVVGDPVVVRAIFDEPTRAMALSLFGRAGSVLGEVLTGGAPTGIEEGEIVARFARSTLQTARTPSSFLADALTLAERITDWRAEERLAEVARTDPLHPVRRGALEALRDHRPGHASTLAALEAGCSDAAPPVRLLAATALGIAKGKATLLGLAAATGGADGISADAVLALRSHLPADRALAIQDAAFAARRYATVIACLDTLSRLGPHADVAARVLDEMPNAEVGIAAAHALRRCGTPAHVELLLEVAAGIPRGEPLAEACRSAVAAIQSRQAGASAGQVSIAGDDAGHVSLAADEVGRVSLDGAQPDGPRDDS